MNQLPSVSVVIPCLNEKDYIEKCVSSVLRSNYPKELIDVYVCDGMSEDGTREIIHDKFQNDQNVHLINNIEKTTPFALNLGLKKSSADIKIILGAHSEVDEDFIVENVHALKKGNDIGCTGGVIENVYLNKTAEIIGNAMSSSFGVGNAHFRTGNKDGYVDTVAFGAYKKEVFEQIGYFDEELARNQDDEFNYRLLKHGFKIYLSSKIKCKYFVRASYKKLFKQYFQYGYWKVFVNKKHKAITTFRQLVPLFFVLFLIGGMCISWLFPIALNLYVGLLFLYLCLGFVFALRQDPRGGKAMLILYSFIILHLSYGLGYAQGIFSFLVLNKLPSTKSKSISR